jgi:hypothetical protein
MKTAMMRGTTDNALRAVVKARCDPGEFKVIGPIPGTFPFPTPDGIRFVPPFLTLKLNWDRASSSLSEIPFPLDKILDKSFTLETGTHSQVVGSATVDEAVRVSFTAR